MRGTIRGAAVLLLMLAIAATGCGGGGDKSDGTTTDGSPAQSGTAGGTGDGSALEAEFVDVVKQVSPAVVQISSSGGLGSGVVYDAKGNIVTNNHVVAGEKTFKVTLADGRSHSATLVGAFPPEDLAVVRLEGTTPDPASFGDSSKLAVGQFAFAIGNPLGLRSSVTEGIISSLGRTVSEGPSGAVVSSAIQTSAPINPGNSGGALVDLDGDVIGIPTLAALDPNLGGAQAPGIGFAIPSNTVKRIADQIVENGRVTKSGRAYLGVRVATSVGGKGVVVAGVTQGGPADKAGVRPGEVIVAVNHRPTPSAEELATVLAELRPDQKVPVDLVDPGGKKRTVMVTLGQLTVSATGLPSGG
jgi:putative serine protease PepD